MLDLSNSVDAACLNTWGVPATFTPQDDSGPQQITGIIQNPAMAEDYVPGSVVGTSVVRFFVRLSEISPQPGHGDTITLNGITYNVFEVEADIHGGAVLKLRIAN
jgi:hypothetical protein